MKRWKILLAVISLMIVSGFAVQAEEVRQPLSAPPVSPTPAPSPACIESRFSKIILNHITDANGMWRGSYYYFVVHWYVDGQHYYVLSPSWVSATGKTLAKDPTTGLWKLTWEEGKQKICVTAPFFEQMTTPFDYWTIQQPVTQWFQKTYPTYLIPGVATYPTPTPPVGI